MNTLKKLVSRFGPVKGFLLFIQLKITGAQEIHPGKGFYPLKLRPNTIDSYTFDEIYIQRVYDIDWPEKWAQPQFIIDGGANIGFTSLFFASKFPEAHIVALEPEDENFRLLSDNTELVEHVRSIFGAVWSSRSTLVVEDKGYGTRGFMVREVKEDENGIQAYDIETLMDMSGFNEVDILKLDIEGSEKEVFSKHVDSWLPKCKCVIVELHDRMLDGCSEVVFAAMKRHGFTHYSKGGNEVFLNSGK